MLNNEFWGADISEIQSTQPTRSWLSVRLDMGEICRFQEGEEQKYYVYFKCPQGHRTNFEAWGKNEWDARTKNAHIFVPLSCKKCKSAPFEFERIELAID